MAWGGAAAVRDFQIIIRTDGAVVFVYDDELRPLLDLGTSQVHRASHVEPERDFDGRMLWSIDFAPIGGQPISGFKRRDEALHTERVMVDKELRRSGGRLVMKLDSA